MAEPSHTALSNDNQINVFVPEVRRLFDPQQLRPRVTFDLTADKYSPIYQAPSYILRGPFRADYCVPTLCWLCLAPIWPSRSVRGYEDSLCKACFLDSDRVVDGSFRRRKGVPPWTLRPNQPRPTGTVCDSPSDLPVTGVSAFQSVRPEEWRQKRKQMERMETAIIIPPLTGPRRQRFITRILQPQVKTCTPMPIVAPSVGGTVVFSPAPKDGMADAQTISELLAPLDTPESFPPKSVSNVMRYPQVIDYDPRSGELFYTGGDYYGLFFLFSSFFLSFFLT
jgi:hypothetical protein